MICFHCSRAGIECTHAVLTLADRVQAWRDSIPKEDVLAFSATAHSAVDAKRKERKDLAKYAKSLLMDRKSKKGDK